MSTPTTPPPETEAAFAAYDRDENGFDPCPWCGAPWRPDEGHEADKVRVHTGTCPYMAWLAAPETEEREEETPAPFIPTPTPIEQSRIDANGKIGLRPCWCGNCHRVAAFTPSLPENITAALVIDCPFCKVMGAEILP